MILDIHDKLLIIGDSITDCGRKHPVGEGMSEEIGQGYVAFIHSIIHARNPELGIRVVNMGVSGNTVRDLKSRWTEDVIQQAPQWVSILIGINDVWRQFDQPFMKESHVYIEEYERTLTELVKQTSSTVKGMILMTPYYLEPNQNDPMRRAMDQYGAVVKRIAEEHKTVFVNLQKTFDDLMEHFYPAALAWDRIHPNWIGHMAIAQAFLKAIRFIRE